MAVVQVSQSELARRIGVTQGAIAKIANKDPNGSSFLHLIARELKTTPAYLTGETDDPDENAPLGLALGRDERQLLDCYRSLSHKERAALLLIAESMNGMVMPSTQIHEKRREFHGEERR